MASWLKASGLAVGLTLALLGGCDQGEGDICQIDDDCKPGLSCNQNTGLCQEDNTDPDPDAAMPDAAMPDAAMPDAAMPDAGS